MGHAENKISLLHQLRCEHAAALAGDIDAQLLYRLDGVRAGRLALRGPESGRENTKISAALNGAAENSFGHGTAADIAGANKKDRLHHCVNHLNLGWSREIVNGEIRNAIGEPRPAPSINPGRGPG